MVLEWPANLVDWGVRAARRDKLAGTLAKLSLLIGQYSPELLLLEKFNSRATRRGSRIRLLIESIRDFASDKGVHAVEIRRRSVRKVFLASRAQTKQEIAVEVARQLPDLAPSLPQVRKPWMSEDYSMAIFQAAAIALAYFQVRRVLATPPPISLVAQENKDVVN